MHPQCLHSIRAISVKHDGDVGHWCRWKIQCQAIPSGRFSQLFFVVDLVELYLHRDFKFLHSALTKHCDAHCVVVTIASISLRHSPEWSLFRSKTFVWQFSPCLLPSCVQCDLQIWASYYFHQPNTKNVFACWKRSKCSQQFFFLLPVFVLFSWQGISFIYQPLFCIQVKDITQYIRIFLE